jgi:small multidrug resistance pump
MLPVLSVNQAWGVLSVAIVLEVAGTTSMRLSEGFSRPVLTALIGYAYFKEPATMLRVASAGLIVLGVFGLHSSSRA